MTLDGSGSAIRPTSVGQNETPTTPGIGRLYVSGQVVGEARQGPVIGWVPDYGLADGGTFGVGQAFGLPVSTSFQPPFNFTGTLIKVTVKLRSAHGEKVMSFSTQVRSRTEAQLPPQISYAPPKAALEAIDPERRSYYLPREDCRFRHLPRL
jgi:hypothetical protein